MLGCFLVDPALCVVSILYLIAVAIVKIEQGISSIVGIGREAVHTVVGIHRMAGITESSAKPAL
jgi:hypothetical protein